MALRPWNVFQKTSYVVRSDAGHVPISSMITLARAKGQRLGAEQETTFGQLFAVILPASAVAWTALFITRWRYSDGERLRVIEGKQGGAIWVDMLACRALSHFGPYQAPNLMKAKLYEGPLQSLEEPLLLDHERSRVLQRLEQITQRRVAALSLLLDEGGTSSRSGMPLLRIESILRDVLKAHGSMALVRSPSHLEASLRIVLDCICALPAENRAVPDWVLTHLVTSSGEPWDTLGPQGEEIRATMMLQLLQCEANSAAAAKLPTVITYLSTPGIRLKADTLWPLKAYLLSGETSDLLRRAARLVVKQDPNAMELPPRCTRDTPNLQFKHDSRNLWTTVLGAFLWAASRSWRGVIDMKAILELTGAGAGGVGAILVVEGFWRAEELIIQTQKYFDDTLTMYAVSAGMCLEHSIVWSWAFRYPVLVPFLFVRLVKDNFLDSYRSFGD
mmetsp:Transcript_9245/g.20655  ORF Transcript_9245/g.20655 Transcript_9245/m.20655 type:complete len:446 (-) Transcript_9245:36-1373(-)